MEMSFLYIRMLGVVAIALSLAVSAPAQNIENTEPQLGRLMGTVTDVNGDAVVGATVFIAGTDPIDCRKVATDENGFFQFEAVKPGIPYEATVSATGFAQWASSSIIIDPGQFKLLDAIKLRIATEHATVEVVYKPVEVATEQVKLEQKQRVLGIVPNFYISYDPHAEPLTAKLKFRLALKVSLDPATFAGIGVLAGAKQAANTPNYGQGAEGYGKRFGAAAADGFSDIMIGGAILPSLLHQDPRYFYQGTGTTGSRIRHAMLNPFIAKGDNGTSQPNYSSLGGDLASSAISNIYYPNSNRGAQPVLANFAIGTAERVGASLAQEFLLGRLTRRAARIE
jgi:hypothetical protein